MSVICGNCSAELEDGAKFCGVCGSKIETEDIPEAYENSEADYQENELSYEEQPSYEEYADAEALQESYEEQPEAEDCSYDDIESEPTVIMDQPAYYYAPQPEQTAVPEPVPVPQTAVQPEPEPVPAAPQPAPAMKKEPAEKPASKKDKAVQTSQPSSDNGNVKVTVNVEVPSEAKTSAPLTKKDLKLQKQQMKLNEKAANAANAATAMNAAVNAAMLQNMGLIKPASRKITFGGVMAAIVFSLFLIVNVALVLGLSVGYGVSKSDLNNFNLVIGSQKFSLKNLGESAEFLEEGGTRELLESIVKSEDGFEVEINGATYDVNLSKEMISVLNHLFLLNWK